MTIEAACHPKASIDCEMSGRKASWPVAKAVPMIPRTSPRRWTNQRLTMSEPKTRAVPPVPRPTSTPHSRISCQLSHI